MFTGIIQALGSVVEFTPVGDARAPEGARLIVEADLATGRCACGDSVAHNGICLTLTEDSRQGLLTTFVGAETLRVTTAGGWQTGTRINLETALSAGEPLGGHMVSGHVDDVATVLAITEDPGGREIWIGHDPRWRPYLAAKGSVALDGISLTINEIRDDRLRINLIPHTLEVTDSGLWEPGTRINLEIDLLARQIVHALQVYGSGNIPAPETGEKE